MFWRRALTVLLFVPLIILIIHLGGPLYLILVSLAVLMMQVEYCRLMQHLGEKLNPVMPIFISVAFCLFGEYLPASAELQNSTLLFGFFTIFLFYVFAESIFSGKVEGELLTVALKQLGIIIIGWLFGYHVVLLRNTGENGALLIYLLIGTIWFSDTGAYLIGRAVGKTKLNTPISPRKTVEGTIAGLVVGTLVSMALAEILLKGTLHFLNAAIIGLILSALGQIGDLSISLMKRTVGVKDSGDIIPGHGGFLDRCDSLIFSAPIFYYYITLTGVLN